MKSIFIKNIPTDIELQDSPKYTTKCPKCSDTRSKTGTRSLQVYRDDDGFIRWECYHPSCVYNVRHAAVDREASEEIKAEWEKPIDAVFPIPFNPEKDEIVKALSKQFSRIHWYKDWDDKYLYAILRKKDKQGRKTLLPLTLLKTGDWSLASAPKTKSLYWKINPLKNKNKPIIIVEGEKAVDEGQSKFPNSILITWPGGAKGVDRGDWDALQDRQILIWPDNDEEGKKAAVEISNRVSGNVSIAYVNHLPPKSDLADDIKQSDIDEAISKRIPIDSELEITNSLTKDKFKTFLNKDHKGIPTGWDVVDRSIHLKGLTIIEGRSSHGKSTVMFNLADNLVSSDRKVIFYSYEMPAEEVLLRLSMLRETKTLSPIPWENQELLTKKILKGESDGYKFYEDRLNKDFFLTDDYLDIDRLVEQLSQPALRGSVIFIDYIQFIPASSRIGSKPRYLQIKDFSELLKNISKKNDLTIITGSQLTAGDQPAQDVAREGKDIYNAADVVLRIWNRLEGNQTATKWGRDDDSTHDGLLLVRKSRAGATSRSFDFDFTDTRKMIFVEKDKVPCYTINSTKEEIL